jgi:plasmid stability protein
VSAITVRKLDPQTHGRLRLLAAQHGRSVEAEVRSILDSATRGPEQNLLLALHAAATEVGGAEIPAPERTDAPRAVELP